MGVIVDDGVRKEVAQLEAAAKFSLADAFKQANEVSVASLAFAAFIPPEYEALLANSAAFQAVQAKREEKEKRAKEEDEKEQKAERDALYQMEIDRNILKLNIDGQEVDISQGDLRKIMKTRLDTLEEQRDDLQHSGRNPNELHRLDNLIAEYQPVIVDLQKHKADAKTMAGVQNLMRQDPELAAEVKKQQQHAPSENQTANAERKSYAAQHLEAGGITAPPLIAVFAKATAPAAQTQTPLAPAVMNQRLQKTSDVGASFGV